MFIRLENIKDSELSWVATNHDTYLVNENPEVLKGLLKWQFLELPLDRQDQRVRRTDRLGRKGRRPYPLSADQELHAKLFNQDC